MNPNLEGPLAGASIASGTSTRGVILRAPAATPGLVSAGGRQLPFTLEEHWRSERPPSAGLKVDLELAADGALIGVRLLDEMQAAKELAGQAARQMGERGQRVWQQALREFGRTPLVAMGLLLVSWFCLDLFSVRAMGMTAMSFTFWDANKLLANGANVLNALQGGGGSGGLWGLLIVAAALAPLLPLAWRDRRANFGMAAPLALMSAEAVRAWMAFHGALDAMNQQTQGSELGREFSRYAQQMADEMQRQALSAISLGTGFYIGIVAAVVLAGCAGLRLMTRA